MKLLAILTLISGIIQFLASIAVFIFIPYANDSKLKTYLILLVIVGLAGYYNFILQLKWLHNDGLKTRMSLILGYKFSIGAGALLMIFQIAGAFAILGMTSQAYIITLWPEAGGFDDQGNCVDTSKCQMSLAMSLKTI